MYHPEWHPGVVGILASRIKERFHRPVIAFAPAGDGVLKGSGRSIQGLHMRDALERLDMLFPGMMLKFGGHAMAAGLTLWKRGALTSSGSALANWSPSGWIRRYCRAKLFLMGRWRRKR
ncbi:hypothetical protein CWS02_04765 [Enterobacter sp. EA-1]|nr:hypothetical protein CWS02_04765 [Enterobacter sp. EA-1]